jgi:hypothetical protein
MSFPFPHDDTNSRLTFGFHDLPWDTPNFDTRMLLFSSSLFSLLILFFSFLIIFLSLVSFYSSPFIRSARLHGGAGIRVWGFDAVRVHFAYFLLCTKIMAEEVLSKEAVA